MYNDYFKAILQYIAPKYGLSLYAGFCANLKIKIIKNRLIKKFIRKYGVNMQEAQKERAEDYACYNDFFIRHLKPECRPIATADITSPVDGFVSERGRINDGLLIQAKGKHYTVKHLLAADESISSQFNSGYFATLYLSPKDYHRIHMPTDGTLKEMTYVPGKLFSVQPATVRVVSCLFAKNERLVVLFETSAGLMAMVLVGAVIVGSIGTAWHGDLKRSRKPKKFSYSSTDSIDTILKKAAEMGYFKLGSTVILLFTNKKELEWQPNIKPGNSIRFGEALANFI
jgi:phosphatidylserine decarboxylase